MCSVLNLGLLLFRLAVKYRNPNKVLKISLKKKTHKQDLNFEAVTSNY